jgi:hypothetical protein
VLGRGFRLAPHEIVRNSKNGDLVGDLKAKPTVEVHILSSICLQVAGYPGSIKFVTVLLHQQMTDMLTLCLRQDADWTQMQMRQVWIVLGPQRRSDLNPIPWLVALLVGFSGEMLSHIVTNIESPTFATSKDAVMRKS